MTYTDIIFYAWPPIAIASCMTTGYLASLILPDKKKEKDLAGLTIYTLKKEMSE